MSTLTAIALNLVGSMGVFSITMLAFGCAVKSQNTFIAARCAARPPTVIYNPNPRHPCQERGNPTLGWILWVMRLTYDTMLRGVPGTGTRDGGLSGALLKVNLDGIVLLRFHHLCLRVCSLACFLYLVVVLPIYATTQCSRIGGDFDSSRCEGRSYNLTDYQQLTLANIPSLSPPTPENFGDVLSNWFVPGYDGHLARLYAVVFVTWIVTYYALRELKMEWGDVLAMRRVYYLEADHWQDRNDEMEQILRRYEQENSGNPDVKEDESYLTDRKPWIPHPEQRDTVPNIELYSVLVGGLPSLPTEVVDQEEVEAVFSRKQSIDWQLSVTTAFFDHCVPNQPGFSSSIAAVTILPSAAHLTDAWNQWYRVAGKLRRLRFIRNEINKRKRAALKKRADSEKGGGPATTSKEQTYLSSLASTWPTKVHPRSETKHHHHDHAVLGSTDDLQVESRLLCALDFGPEQTAAYSREFALGAANLAPYGWHEERILNASLEDLLMMEKAAVEQVHEANAALREAQERIAEDSEYDSVGDMSEDQLHAMMKNATAHSTPGTGRLSSQETRTISTSIDEEEGCSRKSVGPPTSNSTADNQRARTPSKKLSRSENGTNSFESFASLRDDLESIDDSSGRSSFQIDLKGKDDNEVSHSYTPSKIRMRDNRTNRSMSMSSTYSSMSNESGNNRRSTLLQGVGDLGMTVMKMTGLVRTSSSESFDKLSKGKKRASKANMKSARLPSDLGLEAGLWMEHKSMTKNNGSVPTPGKRPTGPRRQKSALSASMHGIHGSQVADENKRSTPKRANSSEDINQMEMAAAYDHPSPSTRRLGSRNISFAADSYDIPPGSSESFANPAGLDPSVHLDSEATNQADSIWTRLEKDNERKVKLRNRLSDMQRVGSNSGDTQSEGSNDFGLLGVDDDDVPIAVSTTITGESDEPKHLIHEQSKSRAGSAQQMKDMGACEAAPVELERVTLTMNDPINHQRLVGEAIPHARYPTKMKPLDENETDDDDSVDMDALAAAARAYGGDPDYAADSHRSISSRQFEDNLRIAFDFEEKAGLRHRDLYCVNDVEKQNIDVEDKWARVMAIVHESSRDKGVNYETKERLISSGRWRIPTCAGIMDALRKKVKSIWKFYKLRIKPPDIVDDLVRDSSYAVVTFTSRQAAVAARHCLTDSRGHDRWVAIAEIPSPPLADAPVCNMSSFRGCVRPVTLSISDKQKMIRHTLAFAALTAIYFFYTIPLLAAQQLVSPKSLSRIIPDIESLQESSPFLSNLFSGFIPALVWTSFFAACPPMFKIIANFGSNATSSVTAENSALSYFWWFMLLSAFTGTSFSTAVINGFNEGLNLGVEIQKAIETTAATIPTQVSATWLNWMIVRVFAVLPTQYLLQLNTFIFSCLGLKCCARTVRGGGAGGPVPYRIYVDSGVVMLCLFALAPASPLIAPAAFTYFLFCTPMLRWTMIFLYRPKFDIGGGRFPFIFDICISGMIAGQIFLVAMMTLKRAVGPAVAAFCPMIPTIWFRYFVRRRYLRAFNDAALLQTSLLDGWDTNVETSQEKRAEFRKFLVDCHKAAYVPVCIAGDQSTFITAEPAVVVPAECDDDYNSVHDASEFDGDPSFRGDISNFKSDLVSARLQLQPGAMSRRASTFQPPQAQVGAMMRRASVAVKRRAIGENTDDGLSHHSFLISPQKRNSPKRRLVKLETIKDSGPLLAPPLISTQKPTYNVAKLPKSPIL